MTRDEDLLVMTTKFVKQLTEANKFTGPALVAYYRQLLPYFNQYYKKNKSTSDQFEYDQRYQFNLGDVIADTLEALERTGGPVLSLHLRMRSFTSRAWSPPSKQARSSIGRSSGHRTRCDCASVIPSHQRAGVSGGLQEQKILIIDSLVTFDAPVVAAASPSSERCENYQRLGYCQEESACSLLHMRPGRSRCLLFPGLYSYSTFEVASLEGSLR